MRARLRGVALLTALLVLPFGLAGESPARASGTGNFEFQVSGTLPSFPTNHAYASFAGSATGNATVSALVGTTAYTANLTMTAAPVSGSVEYAVAYKPYCFVLTQASPNPTYPWYGQVTMSASSPTVTGQVYRSGDTLMGVVTSTSTTFSFTYQRVGATAALVLQGGRITVNYFIPGRGTGSFSSTFAGAGSAVVSFTDPVQAANNCLNGGGPGVGFSLTGDVTVAG